MIKKTLALIALTLFMGGLSAPVLAATMDIPVQTEVLEEDTKKKETPKCEKSGEAKETKATKSSSDCSQDCSKKCEAEKKSDCSKSGEKK